MLVALGMLTVGATFKIAAVPFHYWTPDAYQGAPTPITGFLSVGPKLGAFALLIRLFAEGLGPIRADWLVVMAILAALTMTGGNIVALIQRNVKRMLAYSRHRPHRLHPGRPRGVRRRGDRWPSSRSRSSRSCSTSPATR